ncbi:MAG: AraC family transcriptional regulator [Lachnospiraceae bacterium]|nr:AraC family transcriptional regulator [Lachnospiraceae bacterium]
MRKTGNSKIEYRYYELPLNEWVLPKMGEGWIRSYGAGIEFLHFHNLIEIGYCREGRGILTLDEDYSEFEPGMVSVIPRNFPHTTNSEPGTESWWEYLFFDPARILQSVFPQDVQYQKKIVRLVQKNAIFEREDDIADIARTVKDIMEEFRNEGRYRQEIIKGYMVSLIFSIARKNSAEKVGSSDNTGRRKKDPDSPTKRTEPIEKAFSYVEEHFSEPIKISELADFCAMSEAHFRKLFVMHMHMKPVEYINSVRIRAACDMLANTNKSVDEVALSCGFTTPSTFNRNFRQFMEITPNQWRKDPDRFERKLLEYHVSAEKGWE